MDTDGYGQFRGGRVTAAGIAFELFVAEILSRDPEIELVSGSLLDRRRTKPPITGLTLWLCAAAKPC